MRIKAVCYQVRLEVNQIGRAVWGAFLGIALMGAAVISPARSAVVEYSPTAAAHGAQAIPQDWLDGALAEIKAGEYEFHPLKSDRRPAEREDVFWQAPNRAQNWRVYAGPAGLLIGPRDEEEAAWHWGLELAGWGSGQLLSPAPGPAEVSANKDRIVLKRGERLTEWFVNRPEGVEHGFTLQEPEFTIEGRLVLEFRIVGGLDGDWQQSEGAINFRRGPGMELLRYSQMQAFDADQTPLACGLELLDGAANSDSGRLRMWVEAQRARWPVTIDPVATTYAWRVDPNQASAGFGVSVCTAGDVNGSAADSPEVDIVIGAWKYDGGQTNEGRVFVYYRDVSEPFYTTVASWTAEGDQASAFFGYSVSTAGDVNDDGYGDVIIGAYGYDNGQTDEGRAYVYHGGSSGLEAAPGWVFENNVAGANVGKSVHCAGDVNNDGISDVIVGAPAFANGQTAEGLAYVFHGARYSGVSAGPAWTAPEPNQASANYGCSVHAAGDINGDGFADIVVGANGYDNMQTDEGRVYFYHGSAAGVSLNADATREPDQASTSFGFSVSTAGDVNGDGYADVIVGAELFDNVQTNEGAAYVYHGSASGAAATYAWRVESNQASAWFGYSVMVAGDVNGDGCADVVIGAPYYNNGLTDEGRAYVYEGSTTGLQTAAAWIGEGNQESAHYGSSVSTAADVNWDGFSDILIGAPEMDNGHADEGQVRLYYGIPSTKGLALSAGWTGMINIWGQQNFGDTADSAGDVNGDGLDDLIIGGEDDAYLYLGSSSGLPPTYIWSGQGYGLYGHAAGAGDVNGDGYTDFVIGSPQYENSEFREGALYVYHGSATGVLSQPLIVESNLENAWLGMGAGTAGDINGDGYGDIVASAPYGNGCMTYVFAGSAAGINPAPIWTGCDTCDYGGEADVGTAGDVNRDGYSDIIIGQHEYSSPLFFAGRVRVYYGTATGIAAVPWEAVGAQAECFFGKSVASAGDVNNDGYSDVLIGAPEYDNGQLAEGRSYVYLGAATGLSATPAWTKESNVAYANFGEEVDSAGDVNGDGICDILIGGPEDNYPDSGGNGQAWLYLGATTGIAATEVWTIQGGQGEHYASAVTCAGDVNGDGFADVAIGATGFSNGMGSPGAVFVYYGGEGGGRYAGMRQLRDNDLLALPVLGLSGSASSVELRGTARSHMGRATVWIEGQAAHVAGSFPSNYWDTFRSPWQDSGLGGVVCGIEPTGLSGPVQKWRIKIGSNVVETLYQTYSRWYSLPVNGLHEGDFRLGVYPTPTPTATLTPTLSPTPTQSPTLTPTLSPTPTQSPTVTQTPTLTPTVTLSPTLTPTVTLSPTSSPTVTLTPTLTPTVTQSPTLIPTVTLSPTSSPTVTQTPTLTPTVTQSPTLTPTVTLSPTSSPTVTQTPTLTPTITLSPTLTPTSTQSPTQSPTSSPTWTATLSPTLMPTFTWSPTLSPTVTSSPTLFPTQSPTGTPTLTPTVTRTPTLNPTATVSPTASPTLTLTPTFSPTRSPSPTWTATLSPTLTPAATLSPTLSPTASPVPTASPTATTPPTLTPTAEPTVMATDIPTATMVPTATVIPCVHNGDANGDGQVTPGDAQLAFSLYLACILYSPTREQYCAADFCGTGEVAPCDGSVTPGDAQGIMRHYLGFTTPCFKRTADGGTERGILEHIEPSAHWMPPEAPEEA